MISRNVLDYLSEEKFARYNEIMKIAEEAKANAPKAERKPRGPLTDEQKLDRLTKKREAIQKALDELLAKQGI